MVDMTIFENEVIGTTGLGAIVAGNPHSVTRSGVCDAVIISSGGNRDGYASVINNVLSGQATICIGGDFILELGINRCTGIATRGETTGCRDCGAVGVVVGIQKKLITRTVFPYIMGLQNDGYLRISGKKHSKEH